MTALGKSRAYRDAEAASRGGCALALRPSAARPNAAVLRIARVIEEKPKLEPVAYGLIRGLGVAAAADEIEWLAEHVA